MNTLRRLQSLKSDQDAIDEIDTIDLSEFDLSSFKPVDFEFQKKDARPELRIPQEQIAELKRLAKKQGIPHTRLVRMFIERGMLAMQ